MSACMLPSDIWALVLERALYLSEENISSWKNGLELLAVCSQWRQLGLPLISKNAVLVHSGCCCDGGCTGTWTSNVPLIAASGCTRMIKNVVMDIHLQARPVDVLEEMAMQPGDDAPWINAGMLKITIRTRKEDEAAQQGAGAELQTDGRDRLAAAANRLVRRMPALRSLNVAGADISPSNYPAWSEFVQRLTLGYSGQLRALFGHSSVLARVPTLELSSLAVAFDEHTSELVPRIAPGALRMLCLTSVYSDEVWTRFGAGDIWFNRLEQLALAYVCGSQPLLDSAIQLHFPQLRRLAVDNCAPSSLLLSAKTSTCLQDVRITDRSGKIEPAWLVGNRPVKMLSVASHSEKTREEAFQHTTNRLFGSHSRAKHAVLMLGYSAVMPDPANLQWPRLDKLSLFSTVRSDVLLALLPKVPNLTELVLGGVTLHNWETDEQPLNTRLQKLYFGDIFVPPPAEDGTEFLKRMLLGIASLRELAFSEKHFQRMLEFVRTRGAKYPRLWRIKYEVLC
ncbi:hypothetical protein GGF46_002037 [Coemansia sp. RSA 552]|nr:hypothetical protein GGF46_002037 [Coemansia sp. RSA 552]